MLNGHEVQSPKWLQSRISRIWMDVGGSTPTWVRFYRLERKELVNNHDVILMTEHGLKESGCVIGFVYHVSYLFKGRGKGYLQTGSHNYGHSRLRRKRQSSPKTTTKNII